MAVVTGDARIWFSQYHLSAAHQSLDLTTGHDSADGTVFTNTAKNMRGTLPFVELQGQGFMDFAGDGIADVLRANLNVADIPVTIGLEGAVADTKATIFKARVLQYVTAGVVGQLLPFTFEAKGQGTPGVDATIFGLGSKTATASGTEAGLGVLATGQTMYAALHVMSVSGSSPTLDVIIESDATGFATPTTRMTFAQKIAVGSEWLSLAGPIATDDFWRATWTIGGTGTPTFDIVVAVGIATNP